MDSAFWSGYHLQSFLFDRVNVSTPEGLIGLCVITSVVAFCYEVLRTLKDWSYLKFLTKRKCQSTPKSGGGMVLHEMKSQNGVSHKEVNDPEKKVGSESNAENNGSYPATGTAVMATGTVAGVGGSCKGSELAFRVGLVELISSTIFHMCQVCIGYILMLMVMTFNVYIFLAVLIGVAVGFFVFDGFNRRIHAQGLDTRVEK